MSPAERAFWTRAQRRASDMSVDVARAYLHALASLRDRLSLAQIEALVRSGNIEAVVRLVASDEAFARAFVAYTREIRNGTQRATIAYARNIPKPPTLRTVEIGFDILNPKVIDAVRTMETRSLGTIQDEVRGTVRAHIESGLRDGVNPRTVSRELRDVIGLAPNQEQAVRNFSQALRDGDFSKALGYQLRDRRSDGVLERLAGKGGALSDEQVASMTARYRKNFVAWNAETHARTAALDAQRLGQRLSWQQSIDSGMFEGRRVFKRWVSTLDDRVRPEHEEANGIEVEFDQLFPVDGGVMTPGEGVFNCRCVAMYRVELRRAS